MRALFFSCVFMLIRFCGLAQESISEKLFNANKQFEKGQISEAIAVAVACSKDATTVSEKWQSYYLLTVALLANSETVKAKKIAEELVDLKPTFKPSKTKNSAEFIKLIESVKVIPKFSFALAASVGLNTTYPVLLDAYNGANYTKTYKNGRSWLGGVLLSYHFSSRLSAHTGLIANKKRFELQYTTGGYDFHVKESKAYLDLPIYLQYSLPVYKHWGAHIQTGLYGGRLLSSFSDFNTTDSTGPTTQQLTKVSSYDRNEKWEYGSIFGGGVSYSLPKVRFSLNSMYWVGWNNSTNSTHRYTQDNLFYGYYFVDDDLALNSFSVLLSLSYNLSFKVLRDKTK